jgi:hypothetical protein
MMVSSLILEIVLFVNLLVSAVSAILLRLQVNDLHSTKMILQSDLWRLWLGHVPKCKHSIGRTVTALQKPAFPERPYGNPCPVFYELMSYCSLP